MPGVTKAADTARFEQLVLFDRTFAGRRAASLH